MINGIVAEAHAEFSNVDGLGEGEGKEFPRTNRVLRDLGDTRGFPGVPIHDLGDRTHFWNNMARLCKLPRAVGSNAAQARIPVPVSRSTARNTEGK